jgi:hypothetical protein
VRRRTILSCPTKVDGTAKALNEVISALSKATEGLDEFDSFIGNAAGEIDQQTGS